MVMLQFLRLASRGDANIMIQDLENNFSGSDYKTIIYSFTETHLDMHSFICTC